MRTARGLDEESVLALVNDLHKSDPAKRTFTLAEVAEGLGWPGGSILAQRAVATNDHGEILEVPAMPAWAEALNVILKKLGQDGKLTIITTAVAVFPQELR